MLSAAENELLTRVGPGTPMGALMREYWLPAMLSSELPQREGAPIRVMLLGEQLIGFRDSDGRVGLIQNHCPHRGASLFFGRNEEGGLRCVYHGWKFDCAGNCLEMPNEPAESNFKQKVKARAYPCVERAGIVWAYLGPRSTSPPLPGLEALEVPDGEYDVGACLRSCSWLQALEGDLAQFLFPCFTHIPGWPTLTRAWVPMDDTHTMFFVMDRAYPGRPRGEGIFWSSDPEARILPSNTSDWFGRFRSAYQREDDYGLDRQRQREDRSMWGFSGIIGVQTQDQAVTESMGGLLDRTIEHVGTADVMVLQIRRRLLEVLRTHAALDAPPPGADEPDVYRTRSAALRLPVGVDWVQATESARAVASARSNHPAKDA